MSPDDSLIFNASDLTEMKILGQAIASHLSPGDIVFMRGDLGAGKSTLVRIIIQELLKDPGIEVPSPTFLIVLPYENENWNILHADLYRIENPDELEELGLFEDADSVVFIEWPERAQGYLPRADLDISLTFCAGQTGRIIDISSPSKSPAFTALNNHHVFRTQSELS